MFRIWIRIHKIRTYVFGLPDPHPDPLVRGTDPRTVPKCHGSPTLDISTFFPVREAVPQLSALTDEEYFLRQGGRNVGGQEVWAEPECPALAPALVRPGQKDEALLSGALVSRYEEFLVRTIERIFTTPSKAVVWIRTADPDPAFIGFL